MISTRPTDRHLLLLFLFAAIAAASFILGWGARSQPLPEHVLRLAKAGVSRNADWDPIIRRLDGLDMALVPAGCFIMGATETQLAMAIDSCERFFGPGNCQVDLAKSETPTHEVCFDQPFWIGETEVTNRQFGSSSSTDIYRGPSRPKTRVAWYQASQFCLTHNARLPTEAEWEFAARGPDELIFPWGNEFALENVISGRLSPADVGAIPAGISWVGAFDMSGGVAEWVADRYVAYEQMDLMDVGGSQEAELRVLRGGSWFSFAAFFLRASHRDSASPDTANSTIGFRCARD